MWRGQKNAAYTLYANYFQGGSVSSGEGKDETSPLICVIKGSETLVGANSIEEIEI